MENKQTEKIARFQFELPLHKKKQTNRLQHFQFHFKRHPWSVKKLIKIHTDTKTFGIDDEPWIRYQND